MGLFATLMWRRSVSQVAAMAQILAALQRKREASYY
jgi:hypothetical protein